MALEQESSMRPREETADPEALAIAALGFLAADPERLERYLALTGLTPATLRQAASAPGFLVTVLDYLMADESLLVAFCANHGLDPARIGAARDRLERGAMR